MIKFIHCADLHLDAPFQLSGYVSEAIMSDIHRASFESFSTLIKDAIQQEVDFVLIAGDVLAADNQTLRTTIFLKKQFQRLKDAGIYVYIILGETGLPLRPVSWPDNVIIFNDQVESYQFITKSGDTVYIHGTSSGHDISYFPTNQVDKSIHIGMLYGELGRDFEQEALNEKLYHYWALGGRHKRQLVSEMPHIHYPGNIQSYLPAETGRKGYLMVEGDHIEMKVLFVPVQHIIFGQYEVRVEDLSKNGLLKLLEEFKGEHRPDGKGIYQIELINQEEQLITPKRLAAVKRLVQQHERHDHAFVWIDKLTVEQVDTTTLHREFDAAMIEDDAMFDQVMQPLYHDLEMSRFLDDYTQIDRVALIHQGERKLKERLKSDEN